MRISDWSSDVCSSDLGADTAAEAFEQIYAMLKPGGVLGVVDHRLPETMDSALEEKSGYMKRSSIVAFAEAAGFKLENGRASGRERVCQYVKIAVVVVSLNKKNNILKKTISMKI